MFIEAFGHGVRRNGRLFRVLASILENGTTMLLIYIRISRVHDGLTFREIWNYVRSRREKVRWD